MQIEFERTEEDMIQFNLFHLSHSPSIKQQIFITQIVMAVLVFILPIGVSLFRSNDLSFSDYLVGAIFSIAIYFAWPYMYRTAAIRGVKRLLKEGNNKSLLGPNIISLLPEGIFGKSPARESKLNWSSIDKILQNDKYIFIYLGAINALVIPKNAFASDLQRKEFLNYLDSHIVHESS